MKIIVSDATFGPGGAERVLSILSYVFSEHYEEVIYLSWIDVPDFYSIDSRIKRICVQKECKSTNLLYKCLWFRKFIKRENPNLVLSFLTPYNVVVCLSLIGFNIPVIVAERNDPHYVWNNYVQRYLRKWTYGKSAGIIEQTENNKSYYHGYLYNKTEVIYNPIVMQESYIGKALRTPKKKRIVSVSRLMKQKNQIMLLKAFKIFHETHPEYTLTIYGKGDYRPTIEQMINKMGLQEAVGLPGPVNDLWDRIADAECFVLSSWYEGMPNALLEALCLGLPCISTKVSGATDLIQNGENGVLVDLDDDISLANALCNIIDNREYSIRLGENATHIYDNLNVDVISKEWVDYIDRFIQ